jgi:hypothetical protein
MAIVRSLMATLKLLKSEPWPRLIWLPGDLILPSTSLPPKGRRPMMRCLGSLGLLVWFPACLAADDWPAQRFDAARSGISPQALPDELALQWRFYAEGAVRFSPIFSQGKLCFGADDGRLYCLDAKTGGLRWRFDGAPTRRKIINHERIASNWLVTGGPVLSDGVVCYSCGAWPLDGVCVYGIDADSGRQR